MKNKKDKKLRKFLKKEEVYKRKVDFKRDFGIISFVMDKI